MHIPQPETRDSEKQAIIEDLEELIRQPTARQLPPCPKCVDIEEPSWDKSNCSAECEHASRALSEDPERYPVEENVVPLVFELTTMRLVHTCWSCEGHTNVDGEIWKLPQVSFFAEKPIYAHLLANYLNRLHWEKALIYPWEIVLSNYGRMWDMIYTIKCDMDRVERPYIELMQKDLLAMAVDLSVNIKDEARSIIRKISR